MSRPNKYTVTAVFLLLCSFFMLALRYENSRFIPCTKDFTSEGGGPRYAMAESSFVELANILPAARRVSSTWRACSLGKVWTDSIRSNPNVDSLAGDIKITGSPTISSNLTITGLLTVDTLSGATITVPGKISVDTLATNITITGQLTCDTINGNLLAPNTVTFDSTKFGGGGWITSISVDADTLIVVIGGATKKFDGR